MKLILDTIADPKEMYLDERVPFYSLRRRLAARMEKHPEQFDEMIKSLHELIHCYEGTEDD